MTIDTPLPTNALLASFHSGRWVFIQIPPSGIKLDNLANAVASIFSTKLAFTMNLFSSLSNAPSAPNSSLASRILWSSSWSKTIVSFGFSNKSEYGLIL